MKTPAGCAETTASVAAPNTVDKNNRDSSAELGIWNPVYCEHTMMTSKLSIPALVGCATLLTIPVLFGAPRPEIWTFDRLDRIGGLRTTIVGHPRVIKTPLGKAVQFNGVDDALFLPEHPLAGAETFTFEAIFRPGRGGAR